MTQPFFNHPYLSGHHEPVRFEATAPDLIVDGDLPADLAGVFYRNGPEPLYPTREGDYHWFDGDGMVYAMHFQDGRVSLRNRWVRTEKFELEKAAGRRLFGMFGNPMTSDPSVQGKHYNTGNTNIILHGGKLLALMEGSQPVAMDPFELTTLGVHDYDGTIASTFSAHPKIDYATGELVNIGANINGWTGEAALQYTITTAEGVVRHAVTIPIPHFALIHTFFLTENWVVIPVVPLDTDIQRGMRGGPMTAWNTGRPTKLAILPREGTADDVRWFEFDPRHMFHECNAWEENGQIIADVAAANGTALFPDQDGNWLTHADTKMSLRRWTIDIAGASMKEATLNDRDIQFPRPDDRMMARKTRHAYGNMNLYSVDGRVDGMDAVLHYDTASGKEDFYHFGPGSAAGELVVAPRVGATHEADGYAMTLVHRANSPTSELAIFAATDIAAGPIATVRIPFRVPSGFHCNYYSADNPFYEAVAKAG
ncbi:carotenoid oxygenase [Porphyrobacter sp. SLTP]|uniref:carotenoid oxygenase family protein n=1 Tax=Porphyrobacter sp. SLTP TaxID=2683266 RepID=UPI00141306EE|nr:carotenoid oxygenase family protein [Porphyrobacter sp. SLTP]NBB26407.1 carotenoid oxygenase [Porphyrobacter sp. SLTP]